MSETTERPTYSSLLNGRPVGTRQLLLVGILLLVLVIDGIDVQLLSLLAPVILEDWSVGRAEFGPAMAGAAIGMACGSLVGGTLGDRFGRRPLLVISVASFGLATVLAGMTESITSMAVLRVIGGFGFGAAAPNAMALANDWMPERVRSRIISLLAVGQPGGGMIGAMLVLLLLPLWGWRGAFFACGILTLLVVISLLTLVPESPSYLALKGRENQARRNLDTVLRVGDSATVTFPAPMGAEAKGSTSFLARHYLRLNLGAGMAFFATAFATYSLVAWSTVMLTSLGFALEEALKALFAFNLAAVGASIVAGFLLPSFGSRILLAGGALLLMLVLVALLLLLDQGQEVGMVRSALPVQVLLGCAGWFAGTAMASIYSMTAAGFDVSCRSGGLGFGMSFARVGGIIASFLGGRLLEIESANATPFLGVVAVAATLSVLCAFISDRHIERRTA